MAPYGVHDLYFERMTKHTSRKPGPEDTNELAKSIVDRATGQGPEGDAPEEETPDDGKDPNAVALGRKGGKKGGRARADSLTAEERSEIARKAAQARWSNKRP